MVAAHRIVRAQDRRDQDHARELVARGPGRRDARHGREDDVRSEAEGERKAHE